MAARRSLCLPHVRQTLAGSTKVLERDEAAKKPPESAVVASAVAFMGPKWRRPPVFYFSLMMAADTEKLATDSWLSTHPASVSACMALPQAREARPQTREARPLQTLVARYDAAATAPVPPCSPPCWRSPLLIKLNWSGELLNHAPAWGGNWLRRAKRGW